MRKSMTATVSVLALILASAVVGGEARTTPPAAPEATAAAIPVAMTEGGRSYAALDAAERDEIGIAEPGWAADELIGAVVVDHDGGRIGAIADLLVDANDEISRAILEVSGDVVGVGEQHFVAVELGELRRAEGDETEALTLDRPVANGNYLHSLSAYERDGDRWVPSAL